MVTIDGQKFLFFMHSFSSLLISSQDKDRFQERKMRKKSLRIVSKSLFSFLPGDMDNGIPHRAVLADVAESFLEKSDYSLEAGVDRKRILS